MSAECYSERGLSRKGTSIRWAVPTLLALIAVSAGEATAAEGEAAENPLFAELTVRGVPMSDGALARLPVPSMPDGLDAAGQQAALARLADDNHPLEELLRPSIVAPLVLQIRAAAQPAGTASTSSVDAWFVAYGKWQAVTSQDFLESLLRFGGGRTSAGARTARAGFLEAAALAKRGLPAGAAPERSAGWYFASATILDRVELSAVRQIAIRRTPRSLVIATQIDPRFDRDPEFPNQWRSIACDPENPEKLEIGPAHAYHFAGFYGKVTRLDEPAGGMLVEYHMVFEEPEGWFHGLNLLRSKLPLLVQEEVRTFRRKLAGPMGEGAARQ
jgi:hypothetical protein